jgi:NADH:ubiquinone oxidoreductase subunit
MFAKLTTFFFTMLRGKFVGEDDFGNKYYRRKISVENDGDPRSNERRWVIYNGLSESSKVPADWHNWLHYSTDKFPDGMRRKYFWEKPHMPNLTGTKNRYLPTGHINSGKVRQGSTSDYIPWQP